MADREHLREKWESSSLRNTNNEEYESEWGVADLGGDSFEALLGSLGGLGAELYALSQPNPKVDSYGQPVGIAPRLALVSILEGFNIHIDIGCSQEFSKLVDKCVADLRESFKEGLEDKCRVGAANVR
jgi:hypothetical protein